MSVYTIKEVSQLLHLPASTLRYYEDIGILPKVERTSSGQRIYTLEHINRLKSICCFKRAGMSISKLQTFFSYEENEFSHIDEILSLLTEQKEQLSEQLFKIQEDFEHVKRKISYYNDIKKCIETNQPIPCWSDYEGKYF